MSRAPSPSPARDVPPGADTAAPSAPPPHPPGSTLRAWAMALRPRSLPVAVSPVLIGGSLGWLREGRVDTVAALLVLGAALLMQLITNLQNDVGYTVRGAERLGTRTGLPRATALGLLSVRAVRGAIVVAALVAMALGLVLAAWRGWPVLALGVASLLAALAYMGGPRPIAYTPLGELTVFVFFGLVAVTGTDWVLTQGVGAATVLAAAANGGIAAAALAVNNHRDHAHDAQVGRRTFAVCFGAPASRALHAVLLLAPFALVPAIAWAAAAPALLLPLLLAPAAWRLRLDFAHCAAGPGFTLILFRTFRLQMGFGLLLALGALLTAMTR